MRGAEVPRFAIWNRLDVPGMDACRFRAGPGGWFIDGAAVFIDGGRIAKLTYEVACHKDWNTREARVKGWIGERPFSLRLERTDGDGWLVNGKSLDGVSALVDVDLGFTPATNTNAIRRLGLRRGEEAEVTAVWLDAEDWTVKPLRQIYRRKSDTLLAYSSPAHLYHADITVDDFGVVESYPGLWEALRSPLPGKS